MAGNPERPSLLVVEDDPLLADQIRWALGDRFRIRMAGDRMRALAALEKRWPDLVLLDLCLPPERTPEEGFRILRAVQASAKETSVVVMSAVEERSAALRAVSEGAYDFFSKPLDLDILQVVLARAVERQALARENRRLREQLQERHSLEGIVGVSPAWRKVLESVHRVKDSMVTVILEGESGTGKELIARAIHFNGARRGGAFIPLHCGALPESLLEAELFGHERGAFTGAVAARLGRFEAADGGSLFLDEIATLTPSTQIKLLRFLEDRTVERLGSNRPRKVDLRLIVATNEDLRERVRQGTFREDLFFRVNVFSVRLPPLRERAEDIPLLADEFLRRSSEARGVPRKRFSPEARKALMAREWPGNVRELLNFVETLSLLVEREIVELSDLPPSRRDPFPAGGLGDARDLGLKKAVEEFEKQALEQAIARCGGAKGRAARELRLDPNQMKYLVRKHHL